MGSGASAGAGAAGPPGEARRGPPSGARRRRRRGSSVTEQRARARGARRARHPDHHQGDRPEREEVQGGERGRERRRGARGEERREARRDQARHVLGHDRRVRDRRRDGEELPEPDRQHAVRGHRQRRLEAGPRPRRRGSRRTGRPPPRPPAPRAGAAAPAQPAIWPSFRAVTAASASWLSVCSSASGRLRGRARRGAASLTRQRPPRRSSSEAAVASASARPARRRSVTRPKPWSGAASAWTTTEPSAESSRTCHGRRGGRLRPRGRGISRPAGPCPTTELAERIPCGASALRQAPTPRGTGAFGNVAAAWSIAQRQPRSRARDAVGSGKRPGRTLAERQDQPRSGRSRVRGSSPASSGGWRAPGLPSPCGRRGATGRGLAAAAPASRRGARRPPRGPREQLERHRHEREVVLHPALCMMS